MDRSLQIIHRCLQFNTIINICLELVSSRNSVSWEEARRTERDAAKRHFLSLPHHFFHSLFFSLISFFNAAPN